MYYPGKLFCDGYKEEILPMLNPWRLSIDNGCFMIADGGVRSLDFHNYECIKKFFENWKKND